MADNNLSAYVTNLGKYNEGVLCGEWVKLPVSDKDYQDVLKRIGIGDKYEETFITDYDNYYDIDLDMLGEYESINYLNKLATALNDINDRHEMDVLSVMVDDGYNIETSIANLLADNVTYYTDMHSLSDIGEYFFNEAGCDTNTILNYIDYDKIGRDLSYESYQDDNDDEVSAGMYWCNDDDASDYDIGVEYVSVISPDAVSERDIDFETYGQDILYDDYIFDRNVLVDMSNYDSNLTLEE